jgi:tetratricopeptide (TPR) repeat protein
MAQVKAAPVETSKRSPRTLAGIVPPAQDSHRIATIKAFETALDLLHHGKYAKAKEAFTKMLDAAPPEVRASIRMHINICLQQVSKGTTEFESHEERYDYAISLLNEGHYEPAREQFREIVEQNPSADYVFYGMAVLASLTGDSNTCLEHLAEAIKRDPMHRLRARGDSDFQDMADDPRFTELLYPEA